MVQLPTLMWHQPTEELQAEYLNEVRYQVVDVRVVTAGGALSATTRAGKGAKELWPAGETTHAAGDADPPSMRALHGAGYGAVQLKEGA